jgi:ABC-type branched-subunit amino acid transport system ATPase component
VSISSLLRCENLTVDRAGQTVLKQASLAISAGEAAALIGRNGAGKTTLLEAIAGVIPARAGVLLLNGRPVQGLLSFARAKLGIHLVPDRALVFPNLTVEENLSMISAWRPGASQNEAHVAQFPFLASHARLKAGRLSGGQKRIVALTRALISAPKLLMVDEFSEGLPPSAVRYFLGAYRKLCGAGMGCLLVVHSGDWAGEEGLSRHWLTSAGLFQSEP